MIIVQDQTNYQKFKEILDDFITENLKPQEPIEIYIEQLLDKRINFTIKQKKIIK